MAGTSLLTLLDDIAALLDDVAVMTKVASRKAAGVLGDDLALNAEQVTGVKPDRELPVVWAVFKGSARNKVILVPAALAISAIAPWLIVPLLMLGGLFLCYEGFEKVAHKLLYSKEEDEAHHAELVAAVSDTSVDLVAFEKDKIRGAIRTDFILSAEIIVITLGTVASAPFSRQVAVVAVMATLMTVFVYGLVAGIVKLDDAGLSLSKSASGAVRAFGRGIIFSAPYFMKTLSIAGTVAMFLVGGGILVHGIPGVEHHVSSLGGGSGVAGFILPPLVNGVLGVIAGGITVGVVSGIKRVIRRPSAAAPDVAKAPTDSGEKAGR